jgi:hypothetical protein
MAATGLVVEIFSLDTCIANVSDNTAQFGTIAAGESVTSADDFKIEYNANCTLDDPVSFALSVSSEGYEFWMDTIVIQNTLDIAAKESILPLDFALHPNYPNPFNPVSTIRYDLPQASEVSLIVYDILGREVARLVDDYMEPGYHRTQWNGRNSRGREVPSGIYITRLVTPEYSNSIKMLLLK